MLAKAIRQHDDVPKHKPRTLEQQLFPSSSPSEEKPRRELPFKPPASKILRPSPSIVKNVLLPWERPRTVGSGRSESITSNISSRSESIFSKENSLDFSHSTEMEYPSFGGGKLGKLHEVVNFDDFPDDADLDLDEEEQEPEPEYLPPPVQTKSSTPPPTIHYQWSSSPIEHKTAPSHTSFLRYTDSPVVTYPTLPSVPQINQEAEQPVRSIELEPVQHARPSKLEPEELIRSFKSEAVQLAKPIRLESQQNARPSKRRKLPWDNLEEQDVKEQRKSFPPYLPRTIERQQINEVAPIKEEFSTPLPKDKPSSSYPWNKTVSAMKEDQKRLRQTNKRLVKDSESGSATKSSSSSTISRVFLSDEQRKVLALVTEKAKSVFYTGSAGTGKSVLMREIIKGLKSKYVREPDRVAVTASTGLAACNVGGVTLHSFAGIGLGKEAIPDLVKKIKKNQKAKNRWIRTKVLIIDEISMVDGDLFDKLEGIARIVRNNGRPFGGIQLVITGDFFQLPPVPEYGRVAKFAFDAATWNTSIEHTIGLTQVFRQKDPVFANMLNEMRLGKLTQSSIEVFKKLNRPLDFGDEFDATELFPTRAEVDNANSLRMKNLGGTLEEFRATDGGTIKEIEQRDRLLSSCMAPPVITLKKGAQVMLIKNIDETLVNGSLGKVVSFMDEKTFDIYHQNEEEFQAVETTGSDSAEMTQSRKKLKALMNKDLLGITGRKWPVVRFHIADGSTRDLLCQQESWKIELPNGEVQASRSQVPLILAWALSIHKAQGQTLERVKVDLGRIFEKGQAYVALSRATCQEGLQIMRFDPKKVMAHERVRTFYDSLYNIDSLGKSDVKIKHYDYSGKLESKIKSYPSSTVKSEKLFRDDEDALAQLYG